MRATVGNSTPTCDPEIGAKPAVAVTDLRGCILRPCGLVLPSQLAPDDWRAVGRAIVALTSSVNWALADWWAYAEHRYGDRRQLVDADEWDGPGFQACMDAGSVARAFTTSRRREVLTFAHHREVMGFPPDRADALLDWAEGAIAATGKPRGVRALREEKWRRTQRPLPGTDIQGHDAPIESGRVFPVELPVPGNGRPVGIAMTVDEVVRRAAAIGIAHASQQALVRFRHALIAIGTEDGSSLAAHLSVADLRSCRREAAAAMRQIAALSRSIRARARRPDTREQ